MNENIKDLLKDFYSVPDLYVVYQCIEVSQHAACYLSAGSDMSFDIHPRSPTPDKALMEENHANSGDNPDTDVEISSSLQLEKKKWGKAKIDNRFREELERQRYL